MFRRTSPQLSLLVSRFLVSPAKRRLLEKSWAQGFRDHVLSRIDEEPLKEAFASGVGRPNASVRLLTGLHILKEFNNLTDTEVLEQLEFNLQWQHALAVDPTTVHLCQKTLHNYLVRLMEHDRGREMFTSVVCTPGGDTGCRVPGGVDGGGVEPRTWCNQVGEGSRVGKWGIKCPHSHDAGTGRIQQA